MEDTTLVQQDGTISAIGTGQIRLLSVDTVIFAIGDLIDPRLGLPVLHDQFAKSPDPLYPVSGISYEAFDPETRTNIEGVFLAGWARQASTGVVGIARRDGINAAQVIERYLADRNNRMEVDVSAIVQKIKEQVKHPVTNDDIRKLEAIESQIAAQKGQEEFKFDTNEEMLKVIEDY